MRESLSCLSFLSSVFSLLQLPSEVQVVVYNTTAGTLFDPNVKSALHPTVPSIVSCSTRNQSINRDLLGALFAPPQICLLSPSSGRLVPSNECSFPLNPSQGLFSPVEDFRTEKGSVVQRRWNASSLYSNMSKSHYTTRPPSLPSPSFLS